jgi:tetratricopeptide (TPR) repeat protein
MKSRRVIVDLACALIALCGVASAFGQSDATFAKANQEYAAGQFKEAVADYEALVQKQEYSANLFYDLGNAYFRGGEFGRAILNYERALALDRHHAEAAANLRVARDEARALELPPSGVERYLQFAGVNQDTVAATIAFWFAIFSAALIVFARRRSMLAMTLSILSLSIFLLLAGAVYSIENGNKGQALAIVTAKEVEARVATADNANRVLTLPPGSEIKLLSTRGDWIYAALPNNLRGWIPANSAERVRL